MSSHIVPRSSSLLAPQVDYILMDGSGSMIEKWWEMLSALDTYVGGLKTANLNSHLIATVFCGQDTQMIQRDQPLASAPTFAAEPLASHWGGTPLYDAINHMGRHLRELNPNRASAVIVTDGYENGSQYTDQTQARAIIQWMKAKGWPVTFIGCDFNNSEQAKQLGVSEDSCIGVQKRLLTDAAANLAAKRARHYHTGEGMGFTADEKTQFGGYLTSGAK